MLVRATKIGYYGHKRRYPEGHSHPSAGQAFELIEIKVRNGKGEQVTVSPERQFSKDWMERVEGGSRPRAPRAVPPPADEVPSPKAGEPTGSQSVI